MPPQQEPTLDARIRDAIEAIEKRQEARMDSHMQEMRKMFSGAFPDGDPAVHRAYHEAQIAYMTERAALWRDIRGKTLAGMVWMGLLALGTAVWEYMRAAVARGSH